MAVLCRSPGDRDTVLGVNFRGSAGYGKSFLNASTHERAGTMQSYRLDLVDWAVAEALAARR